MLRQSSCSANFRCLFHADEIKQHKRNLLKYPTNPKPKMGCKSTFKPSRMNSGRRSNDLLQRLCTNTDEANTETSILTELESERKIDYKWAILLFLVPAIGGLLFGYDIGATSGAIDSLKSATYSGTDWYTLTSIQEGLIVSSSLIGAVLGSIGAGFIGSTTGRKNELLLAAVMYGVGTTAAILSDGYLLLCGSRVLYGIGIGLAMHGAPSYIAETSPTSLRGLFISLKEALIVFGILFGYFISFLFVHVIGGWKYNYGVALPIVLVFGVGMLFLPDSPRFQLLTGKIDEAKKTFYQVLGNIPNREAVAEKELASAQSVISSDAFAETSPFDIFKRNNWKPLYITLSLVIFQQATGQPSVLYYAQEIFKKVDFFSDSASASSAAVALGSWKLIATFFAASKVESLGRRPLLLYGVSGLTVALVILGVSSLTSGSFSAWAGVFALLLYVGCYQFSFGPVTWLLVGELFPLKDRNQGVALCTFTNFGFNFVVSLLFPVLESAFGLSTEYLIFAVIGCFCILSIYRTVPETKGKSLEEIEALFTSE